MIDSTTIEHGLIYQHPEHCVNQIAMRMLQNGDILAVFNEERFPFHHDSGQTLMTRSRDGGRTWSEPRVVLAWSATEGNWDAGICELADGTLLVNLTITGYFKRGIRPEGLSWSSHPVTKAWGDWSWAYKLQAWLGTYVLRSTDGGESWSAPIPVNIRPMKHGGCRLGAWQLPGGELLMGLYGRIRGYEEEGEGETTRSVLVRSDDGGENWEYFSTLAYDPASIIDYEEPALLRLASGRLVCFLRTHVNPSGDSRKMVVIWSDDDGFSWTPPKWTKIWGFPAEAIALADGRYLLVYGHRREPFGVRGCISDDGITWDKAREFAIREGGLPGMATVDMPGSSRMGTASGVAGAGAVDPRHPGAYQHIGYPSVVQNADRSIAVAYHEWSDDAQPLQYLRCTRFRLEPNS